MVKESVKNIHESQASANTDNIPINTENMTLLSYGKDIKLYKYLNGSAYVLTVPTFSPDNVSLFVDDFQNAMSILNGVPKSKLIV